MSNPIESIEMSCTDRVAKLEEAIQNLAIEVKDSISRVEKSVMNLQNRSKGKLRPAENREKTDIKKTIAFVFRKTEIVYAYQLHSPTVEIDGSKWGVFAFLDKIRNSLCIRLICYIENEHISYDTSFTIIVNHRNETYSKEFSHRFQKTSGIDSSCGYDEFMSWEELEMHPGRNAFVTKVNLTIYQPNHIKQIKEVVDMFCSPTSFRSDCVLLVDGKRIHVNKELMSVSSEYFNTLFNGEFAEKNLDEIVMEDVDAAEFCQLLQTIYPSRMRDTIIASNVECILKLADRFAVDTVVDRCEQFLLQTPPSHSLSYAKKMLLAQEYGFTRLMKMCIDQFKSGERIHKLTIEPEYTALDENTVRMVLENIR